MTLTLHRVGHTTTAGCWAIRCDGVQCALTVRRHPAGGQHGRGWTLNAHDELRQEILRRHQLDLARFERRKDALLALRVARQMDRDAGIPWHHPPIRARPLRDGSYRFSNPRRKPHPDGTIVREKVSWRSRTGWWVHFGPSGWGPYATAKQAKVAAAEVIAAYS